MQNLYNHFLEKCNDVNKKIINDFESDIKLFLTKKKNDENKTTINSIVDKYGMTIDEVGYGIDFRSTKLKDENFNINLNKDLQIQIGLITKFENSNHVFITSIVKEPDEEYSFEIKLVKKRPVLINDYGLCIFIREKNNSYHISYASNNLDIAIDTTHTGKAPECYVLSDPTILEIIINNFTDLNRFKDTLLLLTDKTIEDDEILSAIYKNMLKLHNINTLKNSNKHFFNQ